jgi:hypothetical protein
MSKEKKITPSNYKFGQTVETKDTKYAYPENNACLKMKMQRFESSVQQNWPFQFTWH